ncbi:MAG: FAD:protein FMN transferase [Proteobacteria bacterium]|nr:FAD:protein FMN transferase [Pseudomonadota bacterium]
MALWLLGVNSCNTHQQDNAQIFQRQIFVFGTLVKIMVWHNDETTAEHAFDEINQVFQAMHSKWHAWKPGRLKSINFALRNNQSIELNEEEVIFLQRSKRLSSLSLHYFNPAIGELINLWGFHTDNYPITTAPPEQQLIQSLTRKNISMEDLKFDHNTLSSSETAIWIDFGGIAKGYAIDKAINTLKKHHIKNAIVNAGGDLRSIGKKGTKNWKIAIQSPKDRGFIASLLLEKDESIFTSGNYQRYKQFDGKRYAHILNPFTGYPVEQIISATVIASNGTLADAAATAMIVAGTQNWQKVAQSMGIDQVLLIDESHHCIGTEKMINRLVKPQLECKSATGFK